jgi:hypothetical protein
MMSQAKQSGFSAETRLLAHHYTGSHPVEPTKGVA